MISQIHVSSTTLAIGGTLRFSVDGRGPIFVRVRCFVDKPRPGYRECPECETQKVQSGEIITLLADPRTWQSWIGKYEISAKDADGDIRKLVIPVTDEGDRAEVNKPAGGAVISR